jgi:hypothetical protein
MDHVVTTLAVIESISTRVSRGLAVVDPRQSGVAPVLLAGDHKAQLDSTGIVLESDILFHSTLKVGKSEATSNLLKEPQALME